MLSSFIVMYLFFGDVFVQTLHLVCVGGGCFHLIEFERFLYILWRKPLIRFMICKYFLLVYGLSLIDIVFHRADVVNFNKIQIINYFFPESGDMSF